MAIYYVSPYTTTNGTGTWESPYSAASTTRATLVDGDQVRIVSKYLSTILTSTVYGATNTNNYQITITSGGALGSDFPVGTFIYIEEVDAFEYVVAVSGNLLTLKATTGVLPLKSTAANQTLTIRKVDSTAAPFSTTGSSGTIFISNNGVFNLTFSDGWVADGVRVTDGTAKSLFSTSYAVGAYTWNIDATGATNYFRGKSTYDLSNTHFMGSRNANGTAVVNMFYNADLNLNQIHATSNGYLAVGGKGGATFIQGVTINIKHMHGSFSNVYLKNSVVNLENQYRGPLGASNYSEDVTYNVENAVLFTATYLISTSTANGISKSILNFNTSIDIYSAITLTAVSYNFGPYTANINATIYQNRRASTVTSCTYKFSLVGDVNYTSPVFSTPKINCPNLTATSPDNLSGYRIWPQTIDPIPTMSNYNVPLLLQIDAGQTTTNLPRIWSQPTNVLIKFADGGNPVEMLGVGNGIVASTTPPQEGRSPVVSLDSTVYNTVGPSLKAYLSTYDASLWEYGGSSKVSKTIKIPVVSGTSYTVTGYIKTDQSTYLTGDCRATIQNSSGELVGQNMTTACINTWEQFTLTFTATATEELNFAWIMRFSEGAKSYWLDNLTISGA